jgi:hypothetical protein
MQGTVMNTNTVTARKRLARGHACAALLAGALGAISCAFGADRVVLLEEFTQLTGLPCERAGLALERLVDDHPNDLAVVQIHVVGQYATSWGYNRFFDFYDFWGTPSASFDGVSTLVGASSEAQAYSSYSARYAARLAIPTDVTLALETVYVSGSTFDATATVCVEPGGTRKTVRVYIAQVLDHWPPYPTYHRNGLKRMASRVDLTLAPGVCQDVVRSFALDGESWAARSDVKIIAWAQDALDSYPAAVYQAARKRWPLLSLPGDFDQDSDVDLVDFAAFADCMGDPGEEPNPTAPATASACLAMFDLDCDNDVDLRDFAGFRMGD